MSRQKFRNQAGGHIDRSRPLKFTFNGRGYTGYQGDTLASALLANGVRLIGRSFKYHRPRGIVGGGVEETNALVRLNTGARSEPNLQATRIELFDGLVAESQNCWPSVGFDVGAMVSLFGRFLPSGFYYKTFKWPARLWPTYEHLIRSAAGMGRTPIELDPDTYAHRYAHCQVLVAGGGPAGLTAALSAGRSGARVIIADDGADFGGMLRGQRNTIDGKPAAEWIADAVAELQTLPEVTLLPRTMVSAYYDHNMLVLNQRLADHQPRPSAHQPRQRLWQVRAEQVVLATGAIERPLVFANNDRPGVMLASAARTYVNRDGVRPGARCVVFTNNSSAYAAAIDLDAGGIEVMAIVDARTEVPAADLGAATDAGIEVIANHAVVTVRGRCAVKGVSVMQLGPDGETVQGQPIEISCDLLCMSGGWTPSVHLFSQSRGKLRYDPELTAFVPDQSFQAERSVGGAAGIFSSEPESPLRPLWSVPLPNGIHAKRFVDIQNDVTVDDIALAHREGYRSVEHLKRYTALGMGTDQGRTSNVNGLAIMAGLRGEDIPAVGTTTFRAPFSPITLGAVAGDGVGEHLAPTRRSPMHRWHQEAGAPFVTAGQWLRPQCYPQAAESLPRAIAREARHVRQRVGIVDVSTLGKIDLQGPDAAEFLNRVYVNRFDKLAVGRCKYGLMLRDDGHVYDDGTVTRIATHRFLITTTTAHAGGVISHLEYLSQVVWPDLDIQMISVTDDWAAVAIAGPESRRVLERVTDDIDVSNEALPFMAYREGTIACLPARLMRISFSGELAYEINAPADAGLDLWTSLLAAGEDAGIVPYGTEAMGILRVEKGHVVGNEINGRTTADDLGFGAMMAAGKPFVGDRLARRQALASPDRKQLVGLIPVDRRQRVPRGAQLVADPSAPPPVAMIGEVTSTCDSPTLGHPIALGLLLRGRERLGEVIHAHSPLTGQTVAVTVTAPVFIDPEGERLRG